MWCNPPWTEWPRLADKIRKGRNTCVCIVPAWYSRSWVHELVRAAARILYVEQGHRVFELAGKPVDGIRWGLFFILFRPSAKRVTFKPEWKRVAVLSEDEGEDDVDDAEFPFDVIPDEGRGLGGDGQRR